MPSDFQPYGDEYKNIAIAMTKLGNDFEFTKATDTDRKIFEMAAHNEFGKIGLKVRVNWDEIIAVDGTPTGVHLPGIEPYGRVREESEVDHDRMRHGIVRGLDGGQPGYIRADGTVSEEPIKKIIT